MQPPRGNGEMKDHCVFCEIVENKAAAIVYDDESTIEFVDPRQSNIGHVLVLPKAHIETIYTIPEHMMSYIMKTIVLISNVVKQCIKPDGLNIWQSNGKAGGQEIRHIHFHVFPRYLGDEHFRIYPESPRRFSKDAKNELAGRMIAILNQMSKET